MTEHQGLTPIVVEDWTLFANGGGHWIRDLDLAEKAELKNPRDIKATIRKAIVDGAIGVGSGDANLTAAVRIETEVITSGKGRPQEVPVYYLNEEAALIIVTRLRTPKAIELTKGIVRVFLAVARGQVAVPGPAAPPDILASIERTMVSLVQRLDALEQRGAGVVGPAVAKHILLTLMQIAALLHRAGQAKSVISARTRLDNRLRGAVGWAGTGASWERLPAMKHGDALRALDSERRVAEGIAEALGKSRQMTLRVVKP